MTWKRTVLFLLIFVAVASLYYFKVYQPRPTEAVFSFSPESAKTPILALSDKKSITHLSIQNASQGILLSFAKEKEGIWRITQPINYPAESMIIDGFVSLLRLTPRVRQLSFDGLESKEFGFDTPRFSICVLADLFPKERCLFIASDAAIAKGAYAKWNDENKYFLIDRNFLSVFDKTLYSVRKKQIFTLLGNEVSAIHFQSQKREFEIHRQGKNWMLKKPVEALMGSQAINELLIHLNGLYVKEFLDAQRPDDSKLGLKPAHRVIRINFQDGSEQALIQGREAAGRDAYYARIGDEKTVILLSLGKANQIAEKFQKLVSS